MLPRESIHATQEVWAQYPGGEEWFQAQVLRVDQNHNEPKWVVRRVEEPDDEHMVTAPFNGEQHTCVVVEIVHENEVWVRVAADSRKRRKSTGTQWVVKLTELARLEWRVARHELRTQREREELLVEEKIQERRVAVATLQPTSDGKGKGKEESGRKQSSNARGKKQEKLKQPKRKQKQKRKLKTKPGKDLFEWVHLEDKAQETKETPDSGDKILYILDGRFEGGLIVRPHKSIGWFNVRMDLGYKLVLLLTSANKGEVWRFGSMKEGWRHAYGEEEKEEEAARAYDRVARAHRGEKAKLNFPAEGDEDGSFAINEHDKRPVKQRRGDGCVKNHTYAVKTAHDRTQLQQEQQQQQAEEAEEEEEEEEGKGKRKKRTRIQSGESGGGGKRIRHAASSGQDCREVKHEVSDNSDHSSDGALSSHNSNSDLNSHNCATGGTESVGVSVAMPAPKVDERANKEGGDWTMHQRRRRKHQRQQEEEEQEQEGKERLRQTHDMVVAVKNDKITALGAKVKLQSEERAVLMQKCQNFEKKLHQLPKQGTLASHTPPQPACSSSVVEKPIKSGSAFQPGDHVCVCTITEVVPGVLISIFTEQGSDITWSVRIGGKLTLVSDDTLYPVVSKASEVMQSTVPPEALTKRQQDAHRSSHRFRWTAAIKLALAARIRPYRALPSRRCCCGEPSSSLSFMVSVPNVAKLLAR
jgi:hypothetical protein